MSRIRTVKPEFFVSVKVCKVSRDARYLFLGLLTESDDEGRQLAAPRRITGALFPHDDEVNTADVRRWLDELEQVGLIRRYQGPDGAEYLHIVGFAEHQRVSKPTPSRLPEPPADSRESPGESAEPAGVRAVEVELGTRNLEVEVEEPIVEKPAPGTSLALVEPASPAATTDVELVFEAWKQSTGHPRARLDEKRKRLIKRALAEYPLDDVVDAVRGWEHSPHHRGENDRHTVYNDVELLLRDARNIEKFRDLERGEHPAPVMHRLPRSAQALANVLGGSQ
jgi:hypothetical protein